MWILVPAAPTTYIDIALGSVQNRMAAMKLVVILVGLYLYAAPGSSFVLPANCSDTEFACLRGECINVNITCDGVEDCQDGSDELEAACYFKGTIWVPESSQFNV